MLITVEITPMFSEDKVDLIGTETRVTIQSSCGVVVPVMELLNCIRGNAGLSAADVLAA